MTSEVMGEKYVTYLMGEQLSINDISQPDQKKVLAITSIKIQPTPCHRPQFDLVQLPITYAPTCLFLGLASNPSQYRDESNPRLA